MKLINALGKNEFAELQFITWNTKSKQNTKAAFQITHLHLNA